MHAVDSLDFASEKHVEFIAIGGATYFTNLFSMELKHVCSKLGYTLLKCAKNHGNWFRHFEDVDCQTYSGPILWPTPVYIAYPIG